MWRAAGNQSGQRDGVRWEARQWVEGGRRSARRYVAEQSTVGEMSVSVSWTAGASARSRSSRVSASFQKWGTEARTARGTEGRARGPHSWRVRKAERGQQPPIRNALWLLEGPDPLPSERTGTWALLAKRCEGEDGGRSAGAGQSLGKGRGHSQRGTGVSRGCNPVS